MSVSIAAMIAELNQDDIYGNPLPIVRLPITYKVNKDGSVTIWQNDGDGLDADSAKLICDIINALGKEIEIDPS
jgi:hypothetical protein